MDTPTRTALVTGTTSGLGFETAAQLADTGYDTVIVTGRTTTRVEDAAAALRERTGRAVFVPVALDLDHLASADAAADVLSARGDRIDTAILNAGTAPPKQPEVTGDGIERTVASSLIGHHRLVMRLLARDLLAADASIVISGSEAARGDVPTFTPLDVHALAASGFGGDLRAAIEAQMRMTPPPAAYDPSDTYATAKVFVAWWAAELARRLPAGMTVNAVSPGSTPGTNMIRKAPAYMRYVMVPLLKVLPGMSHSVADGAARYLEVADDRGTTGAFFASRPKKMTGPLARVEVDHIRDLAAQRAAWEATTALAGAGYPVSA